MVTFEELTAQHSRLLGEYDRLETGEFLAQAELLLGEIREGASCIADPDQRSILDSMARALGELIFDLSGMQPSVRLAAFAEAQITTGITASGDGLGPIIIQRPDVTPAYLPPAPPGPDVLPDPGPLPPGSRLPFARNTLFTGRVEPLLALARALIPFELEPAGVRAGPALIIQAVQGMGGIGKTQLAVEFAFRYGRFFHGVHWLNAAQPDNLGAEIAECGRAMALSPWPRKQPDQVSLTLQAWHDGKPRLLLLDSLEAIAAARDWLPRLAGGGARLLVTARRIGWPADLGLVPLRLAVFSPEESLAFLREYLPEPRASEAEMKMLAERLGRLPLTLQLAGRYLEQHPRLAVSNYHARLTDIFADPAMKNWRSDLGDPVGHDLDLAADFALSWQQVQDKPARRLFLLAGYCAPNQPVPCELLEKAGGLDQEACDDALSLLAGLGLLERDYTAEGLAIHPLLAEYARMLPAELRGVDGFDPLPALAGTLARLTHQAIETGLPANFVPLRPHVEAVAPAAETARLGEAGALWNNLGSHLQDVADYAGARTALERALASDETAFGPDHPDVARDANNLGLVLRDLGDLAGAQAALDRALTIDETAFSPAHPNVARDVSNLALVLQDMGDLEGARAACELALDIDQPAFGPDHPRVASDINNLGTVLKVLGDLDGARAAFERALAIDEATFGPDHPNVATGVNNLGNVLHTQGNLDGARAAFERALAVDEAAFGPDHPSVARDVSNLGLVLRDLGDLAGARSAFERALAIDERFLFPDHPDTAGVRGNLASLGQPGALRPT